MDPHFAVARAFTTVARGLAAEAEATFEIGASSLAFVASRIDPDELLHPEEARYVARAVPKRQREFAAGRRCARRAMERLGLPPVALPIGPDRAPQWPANVTGSITHAGRIACAMLGRDADAIGIDLEETARPIDEGVWSLVLVEGEREHLDAIEHDPRLAFSAKEAFFKLAFAQVGKIFAFSAAAVRFDPASERFALEVREPLCDAIPAGRSFTGQYAIAEGYVLTWLWQ
jgi:4'-phosphopantetheinyl transferase EntD